MNKQDKPNAFLFKTFIDGQYRVCVCRRINDKWDEDNIVYINADTSTFNDVLDDTLFSVLFVGYEEAKDDLGGFTIRHKDSKYLKSNSAIAQDLYIKGQFFTTVERGYKMFYEQQPEQTSG